MIKWGVVGLLAVVVAVTASFLLGPQPAEVTDIVTSAKAVKEGSKEVIKVLETPRKVESFDDSLESTIVANVPRESEPVADIDGTVEHRPPGVEGRERTVLAEIIALPPGDARDLAFTELIGRWAEEDLDSAWEVLGQIENDLFLKRAFYKGIMPEVAKRDPEKVLEVIESGQWWQDQWKPAKTATLSVAKTDLNRAVAYVSSVEQGKQQGDVVYSLSRQLVKEQGREAVFEFSDSLKKPAVKGFAIRAAVSDWVKEDADAATTYIDNIDNPVVRNHAVLGLVDSIWKSNPEESLAWVETIADQGMRTQTFVKLARAWQNSGSPDQVDQMLASSRLAPSEAAAVREALAAE